MSHSARMRMPWPSSAQLTAISPSLVVRLPRVLMASVLALLPPDNVKLRFFVPEAMVPKIAPGDTVVVGYSGSKGFWRDVRETAPLLNLFYVVR